MTRPPPPKTWEAIHGHGPTVRLLQALLAAGRLPQAIIFDGIPGCGRRTLVLTLARAFLCPERAPGAAGACGTCSSCRMCAADGHPDLVVLSHDTEAREIPVDELRERVVLRSAESSLAGNGRVFVVPGVERLRPSGANALLKVLEEPPPGVLLLLTTDRVDGLLKTIRSRCQIYRLQPLTAGEVAAILGDDGYSPAEAQRRAARSHGSLRRARQTEAGAAPVAELERLLADGAEPELLADLLERLEEQAEGTPAKTPAGKRRRVLRRWLDELVHELRGELRREGAELTAFRLEKVLDRYGDLTLNLQPRLVLESLGL